MTSRPRSRRPTISSVARVAFSVEPSTSANGCLTPSISMPSATTQVCSPKCTPSTMNATRSNGQVGAHQLRERGLGRRDEPPRHRRSRRRGRGLLGAGADRFQPGRVVPGRQLASICPAPSARAPRCPRTARRPGPELAGTVGCAHPRPRHRHPRPPNAPSALVAVPVAVRCGSWRPRGPHTAATSFSDRGHHLQPAPTARASSPSRMSAASRPAPRSPSAARRAGSCRSPDSGSSCARRSPSSWCSWPITRVPTARQGSGGGPPPQVPREPGQPPPQCCARLVEHTTLTARSGHSGNSRPPAALPRPPADRAGRRGPRRRGHHRVEHRPPGHGPLPAAPPRPARARVTELTTALRKCPISELARFGRTLHTWRDEPAAHFDHPAVSNGPTENLNLKIKDTKRIARRLPQLRPLPAAAVAQPRPHPRRSLTDANQNPRSRFAA